MARITIRGSYEKYADVLKLISDKGALIIRSRIYTDPVEGSMFEVKIKMSKRRYSKCAHEFAQLGNLN